MTEGKEMSLVYVNLVGKNSEGVYEYDFYYSDTPNDVWGFEWDKAPAAYCVDLDPEPSTYKEIRRMRTRIPLGLVQNNTYFSMEDCVNGVVALCYEDISDYETYPEPYRIVIMYGESLSEVERKFKEREEYEENNDSEE